MPRFDDAGGRTLILEVVGYQYKPAEVDNDFDGNWVIVLVDVFDGEQRVKLREPAYLTWELLDLIAWLQGVGARTSRPGFSGLEPYVQFEYEPDAEDLALTVVLAGALVSESVGLEEFAVTFHPTPESLAAFTLELQAAAAAVPIRAIEPAGYASRLVAERQR